MNSKKSMDYRKLFSFAVIFMFAFAFTMPFVMAVTTESSGASSDSGLNFGALFDKDSFSGLGGFFDNWEAGEISGGIAKYFFWALITMLVFSVASKIPGLQTMFSKNGKNNFLGFLFSLLVGFLAMWAIPVGQIKSMMMSYGAMGFVMGAFLPFIILMFFTIGMAQAEGGAAQKLASKIIAIGIWVAFDFWMLGRIGAAKAAGEVITLEVVLLIFAILVTISMAALFKKIADMLVRAEVVEAGNTMKLSTASIKAHAVETKTLAGDKS